LILTTAVLRAALRELLDSPTVAEPPRQALSQKRAVHPMAFYFTLHDFAEPLSRDGYSEYLTPPPPFHGRMFAGTKIDFELPMRASRIVFRSLASRSAAHIFFARALAAQMWATSWRARPRWRVCR
jgi:hydroxyacyl-ACP dehydratase HTD2-like protein with hotdog domain